MTKRLVVVDTNVLVAGMISGSPGSPVVRLLDAMLSGQIVFLLSPDLLAEYRQVLLRPKLMKLHGLSQVEVEDILAEITANAMWREPLATEHAPDPGDDHLWNLLRQNETALLVTGDKLLVANPPSYASVILPSTYIEHFSH